jgi:hypothetical protein
MGTDVIRSDETEFEYDQARVQGYLDNIKTVRGSAMQRSDFVQISGWAADLGATDAVDLVLLFSGDKLIYYGSTTGKRPDVTQALGNTAFENSGFNFSVPGFDWESRSSIRGFAITRDGYFGELSQTPQFSR